MDRHSNQSDSDRIAFIGNYLPRQCGIATFTRTCVRRSPSRIPGATCIALPVNDIESGYAYPPKCVSNWLKRTSTLTAAPLIS